MMPAASSSPGAESGSFQTADAASLLAHGACTAHPAAAMEMFARAAWAAPASALPWLWMATVAESAERVDLLITVALKLDLGPPSWRTASGEVLIALALRRRAQEPERALGILLEASYVAPADARVWLAMAAATSSAVTRVDCLERALELRGNGDARLRAEVLSAMVTAAHSLHEQGRAAAAGAMMHRAVAMAPADVRDRIAAAALAASATRGALGHAALAALDLALRPAASLVADYTVPQTEADLLRSAARWSQRP